MDIRLEGTITATSAISVSRADARDRDKGVVMQRIMEAGTATFRPVIAGETIKGALRAAVTAPSSPDWARATTAFCRSTAT